MISFFTSLLVFLLIAPPIALLFWLWAYASVALMFAGLSWLIDKFAPPAPFPDCNIDPRCHPAFFRDRCGRCWIGSTQINMVGR